MVQIIFKCFFESWCLSGKPTKDLRYSNFQPRRRNPSTDGHKVSQRLFLSTSTELLGADKLIFVIGDKFFPKIFQ